MLPRFMGCPWHLQKIQRSNFFVNFTVLVSVVHMVRILSWYSQILWLLSLNLFTSLIYWCIFQLAGHFLKVIHFILCHFMYLQRTTTLFGTSYHCIILCWCESLCILRFAFLWWHVLCHFRSAYAPFPGSTKQPLKSRSRLLHIAALAEKVAILFWPEQLSAYNTTAVFLHLPFSEKFIYTTCNFTCSTFCRGFIPHIAISHQNEDFIPEML